MDPNSSWFGVGLKSGGSLAVVGYESFTGALFSLGSGRASARSFDFSGYRIGPGLGGGAGLSAAFLFNADDPRALNDRWAWDWGFSLALGGKWDDVIDAARWGKMLGKLSKVGVHIQNLEPEQLEAARDLGSALSNASSSFSAEPAFTAIDIPLAGAGLEVSLHALYGKLTVY
ncbi:MAG: hypothetical protein ACYTDY_05175 [Planctomycetota bacterium]|jgi:hypothetical protein